MTPLELRMLVILRDLVEAQDGFLPLPVDLGPARELLGEQERIEAEQAAYHQTAA